MNHFNVRGKKDQIFPIHWITHLAPCGEGEEEEGGEEKEDVEPGERREHVHKVLLQLDVAVVQHADRRRVAQQSGNARESVLSRSFVSGHAELAN